MRMIDCREAGPSLNAYLDGVLEPSAAEPVEKHLASCPPCRTELEALRRTRSLLAEAGSARAPEAWVREAMRKARRSSPERAVRRRIFHYPAALSTVAAAALIIVAFVTGRFMQRGDGETPVLQSPSGALSDQRAAARPAPAAPPASRTNEQPQAGPPAAAVPPAAGASPATTANEPALHRQARAKESATAPGPAPLAKSIAPPSSNAPVEPFDASKLERKDAAPTEEAGNERDLASKQATGGKGDLRSTAALETEAASPGSADAVAALPSYRVTLAQIHYPEPDRGAREKALNSFAAPPSAAVPPAAGSAPSSTLDETAKKESATAARAIRAVALVDPTGRILSARPAVDDADRRTRDFIAGLPGARVDLPARQEKQKLTGGPAGAASPDATAVSARNVEILLEIVLEPAPLP